MADILSTQNNYRSLSIKDLLQARDLYHNHLLNKANVVGTAVGLYLIRDGEAEPASIARRMRRKVAREPRQRPERTLANSSVREYSWPCVHVFVREWVQERRFGGGSRLHADAMVPRSLFLPDGRSVPVCVTRVAEKPAATSDPQWVWPGGVFGAGMPIVVNSQGSEHFGTAGCLVSDGHTTYVLTNRHVGGDAEEPIFTTARGRRLQIGHGSRITLSRMAFEEVYPEFAGRRTYVNLDAGLVTLEDVDAWTSRFVSLRDVGPLADLNELNITMRLIEAPLVAVGAASGRLEGRIKALFYRYKSVGGYDYVADFLIAPRQLQDAHGRATAQFAQTRPGDSGAVWHLVLPGKENRKSKKARPTHAADGFDGPLRPLAVQWGGQVFGSGSGARDLSFALATNLTTVCRALNVELVTEHNTGALPYWGQLGHYSIAAFAVAAVKTPRLRSLLKANLDSIGFSTQKLTPKEIKARLKSAKDSGTLVPLADVPDIIWKNHQSKLKGGRDTQWSGKGRSTGPEHPTHYADIDLPRADKLTLRKLSLQDPKNISVGVWQAFYKATGHTEELSQGLLPFRVWQFYDALVGFAKQRDAGSFLCAAGLLSHYVGDACQPLHGSMYADGYPDKKKTVTHRRRETGEEYTEQTHVGAGVHSTYETKMIDRHSTDIVKGLTAAAAKPGKSLPAISSGRQAASAIVALMDRAARALPPVDICDAYVAAGDTGVVAVQDALWKQFGSKTIATMADGARVLARIWDAAWNTGGGNAIPNGSLGVVDPAALAALYEDSGFVESLTLGQIGAVLKGA